MYIIHTVHTPSLCLPLCLSFNLSIYLSLSPCTAAAQYDFSHFKYSIRCDNLLKGKKSPSCPLSTNTVLLFLLSLVVAECMWGSGLSHTEEDTARGSDQRLECDVYTLAACTVHRPLVHSPSNPGEGHSLAHRHTEENWCSCVHWG